MAKTPRKPGEPGRPERTPPKGLSEEDLALWRHVTRADVRLPGRDYLDPDISSDEAPVEPPPVPRTGDAASTPPTRGASDLPPLETGRAAGVDKRTAQRLRRGQLAVEARLDLHGLTQAEAHRALNGFLADAQASGKRCVIVITGKGRREDAEGGVLRRAVPHWLDQPPNRGRIIAVQQAQPRHGGAGALYVLLRKAR